MSRAEDIALLKRQLEQQLDEYARAVAEAAEWHRRWRGDQIAVPAAPIYAENRAEP